MKRFCSIISCFLAITILISSSMVTAHAAVTNPFTSDFWQWLGNGIANEVDGSVGFDRYLESVFSTKDSGCTSSQSTNGYHYWKLVSDLPVSTVTGRFRVKCDYCSMYYSDYSSCDPEKEAETAYPHMGAECTRRPFHYSAQIAQDYADYQATSKGVEIKLGNNHAYAKEVAQQVKRGISVDTIVNVKKQNGQWTVSTTTLYRYIDRGYIPGVTNKHLPEKPRRKQRKAKTVKAARAPKGLPIDRRPEAIANRNAFGHWEFDSVIGKAKGKRQSILTLTERKTRFEIIIRADAKTSAETVKALNKTIKKLPQGTFKTITVDNGSEFQDCYGMEHDHLGNKRLTVYYAHPYSSWERGSNERNNRIIRRYFPKKTSFAKITQSQCDRVADAINSMPRKILNWKSAKDLFEQEIANLQILP